MPHPAGKKVLRTCGNRSLTNVWGGPPSSAAGPVEGHRFEIELRIAAAEILRARCYRRKKAGCVAAGFNVVKRIAE
jgi:hypothetical protein